LKGSFASNNKTDLLTGVKIQDLWFSLSGLETQVMRYIERKTDEPGGIEKIVYELFRRLTTLLVKETIAAREKTGVKKVVFAGGVSKSSFIRNELRRKLDDISFGEYSEDNAVGISLLGGRYLWR
jgi:tRNA A37 threonylcarbamoyltransferase TsaD